MATDSDGGGGFGWGLLVGGILGVVAGAFLASGPGREQVDGLRQRTVELTGGGDELKARARAAAARAGEAVRDTDNPMRRAIQEGVEAARRRKQELETEAAGPSPIRTEGTGTASEGRAGNGREGA